MKNSLKFVLKTLAVGIGFAVLGHVLAGCGGTTDDGSDGGVKTTGLGRTDAGKIFCSIPSPTGDEKSPYGVGRNTQNFDLITNDVTAACNAYKALPASKTGPAAGMDCFDAANDFMGTSGVAWCISTETQTSLSNCAADSSGDVVCQATFMGEMQTLTNNNGSFPLREFAACSLAGVFLGWICVTP